MALGSFGCLVLQACAQPKVCEFAPLEDATPWENIYKLGGHPKTSWEMRYMTVKPLVFTPKVQVSMMAPSSIRQAVVTLPHLRPILSPITPANFALLV